MAHERKSDDGKREAVAVYSATRAEELAPKSVAAAIGNAAFSKLVVHRRALPTQGAGPLDPEIAAAIESRRGVGAALPDSVRSEMESFFGADLADVRIHTDDASITLNRAVQAEAFTTGHDVFFGAGSYDPTSTGGRLLLAHELTHVVQNEHGRSTSGTPQVSASTDAEEIEAEQVASSLHATGAVAGQLVGEGVEHVRLERVDTTSRASARIANGEDAGGRSPNDIARDSANVGRTSQLQRLGKNRAGVSAIRMKAEESARAAEERETLGGGLKLKIKLPDVKSTKAPLGPFEVYVTVAPEVVGEVSTNRGVGSEHHADTKVKAGPVHSLNNLEHGFQLEVERTLQDRWPGLLDALRPTKVKLGGEMTGKGAKAEFEGVWPSGEHVEYKLGFVLIGKEWEEDGVKILEAELTRSDDLLWFECPVAGVLFKATLKGKATVHVAPNWAQVGTWLSEGGGEVLAGAAVPALVAAGYIAWVGFGLYEIGEAHRTGRLQAMGYAFADGYAQALADITDPGVSMDEPRFQELLSLNWQAQQQQAVDAWVESTHNLWAVDYVRSAGRAAIVQECYNLAAHAPEEWKHIQAAQRDRGTSWARSWSYRQQLTDQVQRGGPVGISLK